MEIEDKWEHLLKAQEGPDATNFDYHVQLSFEDGSNALFKFAFYVLNPKKNEVAVFTEQPCKSLCGLPPLAK